VISITKEEFKKDKKYFICEECGFAYKEMDWAEKCQAWCKEHNSCNMEITKHAIPLDENKNI
jgi:predicted ATP-dependent serine protease